MFSAKLMNDTPIEIFIDNGATPSILPLCTYNKFPILHTYLKTESNTPIHMGGGMITSHFWLEKITIANNTDQSISMRFRMSL